MYSKSTDSTVPIRPTDSEEQQTTRQLLSEIFGVMMRGGVSEEWSPFRMVLRLSDDGPHSDGLHPASRLPALGIRSIKAASRSSAIRDTPLQERAASDSSFSFSHSSHFLLLPVSSPQIHASFTSPTPTSTGPTIDLLFKEHYLRFNFEAFKFGISTFGLFTNSS
ncbi:hypothetical protein N7532_009000 [Penicillium argentinense]|uniref:Uncharacterized protein n=1 Tax=Penicillium argentinense TaxID=1131581 RepID=A0A9W9K2K5_9EURO|nr:uncharacterized protein N7532_009000 [Penicillium argentinense]KAJ5090316.1 hypothetical protein N7532_009000 [Penicillium argentinense]